MHDSAAGRGLASQKAGTLPLPVPLGALLLGAIAIATPTMIFVARESWSTEQGAHGPIVLMTGFWLLVRLWKGAVRAATPPNPVVTTALLLLSLSAYVFARVTQIVEIEGYVMYACLLVALYNVIGAGGIRRLWFPLLYLAFIFPPPETIVWAITFPMKLWISQAASALLHAVGFPIASQGVSIFIGPYELLVAAACSGLNSIISLSALTLFYIYLRHEAEWQYAVLLAVFIVPVALIANFVRVLVLILITYYAGEATAQGYLHNFAGLLMFLIALLTMLSIDEVLKPLFNRLRGVAA